MIKRDPHLFLQHLSSLKPLVLALLLDVICAELLELPVTVIPALRKEVRIIRRHASMNSLASTASELRVLRDYTTNKAQVLS